MTQGNLPRITFGAVCFFLLTLTLGSSPTILQAQEPIRVLAISHEVGFPREISFTLEAEGDDEIREVTLYYRITASRSLVYGYPVFEPGHKIRARLSQKTDGGSYLPPGVEIEYYYIIKDSRDRELETEHGRFAYLDTRFNWHEIRHGSVSVVWHDRSEAEVTKVTQVVLKRLKDVNDTLGLELKQQARAVIFNSTRESDQAFPFLSSTIAREHVFGGFAYPNYNLFLLTGLDPDGMIHELTHILLHQGRDSPLAVIPAWLDEGLAMYFETSSGTRELILARAARSNRLMSLTAMSAIPGRPQDIETFYAQAWSIVRYLMDSHGHEKMRHLIRSINDGKSLGQAMEDAYGFGTAELEKEWLSLVATQTPFLTRQEISSLIIVVGIALFLLLFFIKRIVSKHSNAHN
ncbi:MAG: hypothetical protein HY666_05455 [Chloroflexi bacterium]|nr:hypothetical protein [Chloroflexota bacterium]